MSESLGDVDFTGARAGSSSTVENRLRNLAQCIRRIGETIGHSGIPSIAEAIIITVEYDSDDGAEPAEPSKTRRKREMAALQELGVELVGLSRERLAKIEMPERLRDAILDAQRLTRHEARRRQLQFVGKLMREVDPAPLQAAIDEVRGVSAAANARQHRLERLRSRLLEDETAFAELAREYPRADIQRLRQIRRAALKEAEQGKPPRAFRDLFRELRELEAPSDGEPPVA